MICDDARRKENIAVSFCSVWTLSHKMAEHDRVKQNGY